MPTRKVITTIMKDGSTTTTTTKSRKKKGAPTIDNTPYNDYRQCCHVFGVRVATICQELIATIDSVVSYWPLGERNDKLAAIRQVMEKTACFSRNLTLSAITGDKVTNSGEDGIDF